MQVDPISYLTFEEWLELQSPEFQEDVKELYEHLDPDEVEEIALEANGDVDEFNILAADAFPWD